MFEDIKTGYTYDDLLLVPHYSEIKSRKDPDLQSEIVPGLKFDVPIVSANMNKVTESSMVKAMCDSGATGILHRFAKIDKLELMLNDLLPNYSKKFGISIGVNPSDVKETMSFLQSNSYFDHIGMITVDVAHGDHVYVKKTISLIKDYTDTPIIAGNIASVQSAEHLISWGANAIKIGIGPGSACTTRLVTGFGYPQLSAIANISKYIRSKSNNEKYNVRIIADGGIRKTGDIVKALAAGADFVMLGGMLAGCRETPGEVLTIQGTKYKLYEGMASIDAQASFFNKEADEIIPEGEATMVLYKGSTRKNMTKIIGSVKAGVSYSGSHNLESFHKFGSNSQNWIKVTQAGQIEGTPHAVR